MITLYKKIKKMIIALKKKLITQAAKKVWKRSKFHLKLAKKNYSPH